jgi:hypothetical protein
MLLRPISIASLVLVVLITTACGTAASGSPRAASASATQPPITYDEFSSALCSSFTSLVRAVGNPDAGTPSVMSKALDDAVKRGDALAADQAAATMLAELEAGRAQAAVAARWVPGAAAMHHMDVLLVAFEASTDAKRAVAAKAPGVDPQKAFEAAGGTAAWSGLLSGIGTLAIPAGASPQPCRAFSGQL